MHFHRCFLVAFFAFNLGMPASTNAADTRTFTYKTTPQGKLELIAHMPADWKDSDQRAGIVFFFGGGWTNGSVKQFEPQAKHLAELGMVAIRADYRVKSRHGVTPEQCVEDAKSAVRWIRANASKLGIDPNRIVAAGGSAGAHIAACTALTEGLEAEGEDQSCSSKPNALVLFNPVLRLDGSPALLQRVRNDGALAISISPLLHVSKSTPPTLMFFGTVDKLMPQGEDYLEKAKAAGVRAELFQAEGQPHGFFNRSPWLERTMTRMDDFLASLGYLKAIEKGSDVKS